MGFESEYPIIYSTTIYTPPQKTKSDSSNAGENFMGGLMVLVWIGIIIFSICRDRKLKRKRAEELRQRQEEQRQHEMAQIKEYYNSAYYKCTGLSLQQIYSDAGKTGEFQIYRRMKYLERDGARFLFNVYIPKEDGTTTEIDSLMICRKGIVVFESKNYGGWIFGDEDSKEWCQVLPDKRHTTQKFYFYNPVKQNKAHTKHLANFIDDDITTFSVVLFSDDCTFRMNTAEIGSALVGYYSWVTHFWRDYIESEEDTLTDEQCQEIYDKLYPCVQVDEEVKAQHIANIENMKN
ncbi:MAG: NERD domain-containing protein [Ruminococcus sp.]|nr:NERD domain-containing protein [Ruminococcus sp.]